MNERLGLSALWDRTAACLRGNLGILLPVAGAFFFLPSIILSRFMPDGAAGTFDPSMLPPVLLILLLQTIGQLVIFMLLADPRKPTVAEAIRLALRGLLPAIGVQLAIFAMLCILLIGGQLIAMLMGMTALIKGGTDQSALIRMAVAGMLIASPAILYMFARLSVVFPALILERRTPFDAIRRAYNLTAGNGWRILALILIATFLYLFLQLALGAALGSVFMLLGKLLGLEALGALLVLFLTTALGTLANLAITVALSFIYRDLARA